MIKFTTPSKKEIFSFLNRFNDFLTDKLGILNFRNFKQVYKKFIFDRRFVLTFAIIVLSIFAHLSTPSFYQDNWVLKKLKKQLENEFNLTFILPKTVSYSMFPVPNFSLQNVRVLNDDHEFGEIEFMKIYLSFNKFFDKEKVNIQDIHIKNSNFYIKKENIQNLINFFNKEINEKKLLIKRSKFFVQNVDEEVFLILGINRSISYYDPNVVKNILQFEGDIFNNTFKLKMLNDYLKKNSNLNFEFDKIGKKINLNLDYLKNNKEVLVELLDGSKTYNININFNDDRLIFFSDEKNGEEYFYNGNIIFKPFYSDINVNFKNFDLFELINKESVFFQILNSEIFKNPNLNYKFELKSQNINNHRLLKKLILCLSFSRNSLNFNDSGLIFDENVELKVKNSDYFTEQKKSFFSGELNFSIKDSQKLYRFFQTKKKFRKELKNISIFFKYDFNESSLLIERLYLNDKSNDKLQKVIENYNKKNFDNLGRIQIKNFFNDVVSTL